MIEGIVDEKGIPVVSLVEWRILEALEDAAEYVCGNRVVHRWLFNPRRILFPGFPGVPEPQRL